MKFHRKIIKIMKFHRKIPKNHQILSRARCPDIALGGEREGALRELRLHLLGPDGLQGPAPARLLQVYSPTCQFSMELCFQEKRILQS